MRVVADTNIFISAFMFGGLPATFLDLAFIGAFTLVTSPAILDELDEKLRGKFELSVEQARTIRWKLETTAQIVDPTIVLTVVKEDADDDRVVEAAVTAGADFVVSGDRHLLRLQVHQAIRIVTVRQFLNVLASPNPLTPPL